MKNFNLFLVLLITASSLSSCGFHSSLSLNTHNNTTNVELSKKNFKVVGKVSQQASHTYILGFGGLERKALIEMAKAKIYEEAELKGSSRAIINMTVEGYQQFIVPPIYVKSTVIVSAWVIEFTE